MYLILCYKSNDLSFIFVIDVNTSFIYEMNLLYAY